MMTKIAIKFAASTLVLGLTMVACRSDSAMVRPSSVTAGTARADQESMRLRGQAQQAIQQGDLAQALGLMERAVELSPQDAGYRLLLADIYLKSGRFEAARATFADVLELDPQNVRAGLSFSLTQIALGRPEAAVAQLDNLHGRASATDLGLAYALAGLPERGIELLEPAARAFDASPRTRQNLALSYALAGDWQRARTIAAQDVSPADLGARMEQWAGFARPDGTQDRVAQLLGVTPVQDPGQPVRLALAPPAPEPEFVPEAVAFAEAEPAADEISAEAALAETIAFAEAAPVPDEPSAQPIQYASVSIPAYVAPAPDEIAVFDSAPAAPEPVAGPAQDAPAAPTETEIRYAAAAQSLMRPEPTVIRASVEARAPAPVFERPRPSRPESRSQAGAAAGRFVVQLGAFSNEANAERAWVEAQRRYGLSDSRPLTTTIAINGRTLHRVSVAGFETHASASRVCGSVKARGGACFVRGMAGDAPIRWAARYWPNRNA